MARRFVVLVIMTGAALLVCSTVATAAIRTGNEGDNTLMGTRYKDSITGKGGDDKTVGKGGNDTYSYADSWGHDTVVDSGGTDTLNFSAVTGGVSVRLCSPVEAHDGLGLPSDGNAVTSMSKIENVRGSLGNDEILGCFGKNTLSGGGYEPSRGVGPFPGEGDLLIDVAGFSPSEPARNYVYVGSKEGSATVVDWGGEADVLDLRGFHSNDAIILGWDANRDGTKGSLVVAYGTSESSYGMMLLANQFEGDDLNLFETGIDTDGRIEQIKFKNKTVTVTPEVAEPASARQSAAIEETLPVDLSEGSLLP
jgi:hypothetical protein